MARLIDIVPVCRRLGVWRFLMNVWTEVGKDNVFTYASALAYSWLFAVFPFFIFLLSLLPYLPADWKAKAEEQITFKLNEQLPKAAQGVVGEIERLMHEPKGSLLSVGLLLTIYAASGGMTMTMRALDEAYDVEKHRPFWKQKPLAVLLTIIVASILLCVFILVPIGTIITRLADDYGAAWLSRWGWSADTLMWLLATWGVVRFTLAILLLLMALAVLHKFGTSAKTRFTLFSPGAIFTIAVWFILGLVFRQYIDRFGKYDKTYGSVGGVVILLLFFYVDALVLLIGAEVNAEIDAQLRIDSAEGKSDKQIAEERKDTTIPGVNAPGPKAEG